MYKYKNKKEVIKEKMLKKIFVMLVLATIVLAFSGLVSAEEISVLDAEKIASGHASEDEYTEAMGELIYYSGKPYHVVGFFKEATDKYKGSVIVDATSGEVVKDEDIASDIFYTVVFFDLGIVTSEELAEDLVMITDSRNSATEMEFYAKNFTDLAKEPGISSKLKRDRNDAASSFEALGNDFSKLADIEQEMYDLEKQWLGKKDTKLTKDIVSKYDELISYISTTFDPNIEKVKGDFTKLCDTMISETTDPTEKASLEAVKQITLTELTSGQQLFNLAKDEWKRQKTEIMEGSADIYGVKWEIEKMNDRLALLIPTPTPTPSPTPTPTLTPSPTPTPEEGVPGFEAVFAIAGLLTVAYLLRRRK